ncbi:uncharacterized protein METZ01_LOCUS214930 [marine metagenome]|uniref:Uncharacterized protein n=1 Tax=marine metagenome TaxID=408172 RepID=A0A382FG60_9ZZZZ
MKKLFTLFTMAAFAFSIAMVDAADDKKKKRDPNAERTIKGTLKCAKCSLKKTEACQAALEITRKNKDGKETTRVIMIKNDDVSKAFHKEICKADVFAAVTGKFEGDRKNRILVATKIEKAKPRKKK